MGEQAVPALPCISLDDTISFYHLLGFQATYRQKSPNPYGIIRRGDLELHLFGLKGLTPEQGYSTCLVISDDVESLHQLFAVGLREGYGKVPYVGFPRITRMRKGQSRFTLVDPSGNSLIFVKRQAAEEVRDETLTELERAIQTAAVLRDSKADDVAAAKVLDVALKRYGDRPAEERAAVLLARAELAFVLGESDRYAAIRNELRHLTLSENDKVKIAEGLLSIEKLR